MSTIPNVTTKHTSDSPSVESAEVFANHLHGCIMIEEDGLAWLHVDALSMIRERDAVIRADERLRVIKRLDEIASTAIPPNDLFCHGWIKALDALRGWLATDES